MNDLANNTVLQWLVYVSYHTPTGEKRVIMQWFDDGGEAWTCFHQSVAVYHNVMRKQIKLARYMNGKLDKLVREVHV